MASYDEFNGGAYTLEKGDYTIAVKADSHVTLDSRVYTQKDTLRYGADNTRPSDAAAAVNRLQNARGEVEYLSRKDGFANYETATAAPADLNLPEKYIAGYHLNANYDPNAYINPDDPMPTTGVKNGLMLAELRGRNYDDPD